MKKMTKTLLVVAALACASGSAFADPVGNRINSLLTTTAKQTTVGYAFCNKNWGGDLANCQNVTFGTVPDSGTLNIKQGGQLTIYKISYTDSAGTHNLSPKNCQAPAGGGPGAEQDINLEKLGDHVQCTYGTGAKK